MKNGNSLLELTKFLVKTNKTHMASNSNPAKNSLGVPNADKQTGSKRKMTAAIIEDLKEEQEVYEFLEEDDDFEEFEMGADYDEYLN